MLLKKPIIFYLIYIGILIIPILEEFLDPLSLFDEFLTMIAIIIIIINRENKALKPVIYYITLVLALGMISTFYYGYQTGILPILKDIIAISKFPIALYGFSLLKVNINLVLKRIERISIIFSIILLVFGVLSIFINIGMSQEELRYGFHPYKFLYHHPTFLVMELVMLIAVLVANGFKKNKIYILINIFTIILTFRTKAVIVIAVLLVVFLGRIFGVIKYKKILIIFFGIGTLLITYYFSIDKISAYTSKEYQMDAARTVLTYTGLQIAGSHFPLGTGFCTYGSYLSATYYSPLYTQYKLYYIQGLEKGDISYAADIFWPSVYVQYGFIGVVFYILILFSVIKYVNRSTDFFSDKWISAYIIILYAIAASTSEAVFTNTSGVFFPIVMVYCLGNITKVNPKSPSISLPLQYKVAN